MTIGVSNVSPADLSTLEPAATLTFDVTSFVAALSRVLVCMDFPESGRPPELVHDDTVFSAHYTESSRTAITGGYRFVLRNSEGWAAGLHPLIFAWDTAGQEL